MLREQSKVVEHYLDYAKQYAELSRQHADELCAEMFPDQIERGLRLIAHLTLDKNAPDQLRKKLEALSAVKVSRVVVCPHTLTVYVFGPNDQ